MGSIVCCVTGQGEGDANMTVKVALKDMPFILLKISIHFVLECNYSFQLLSSWLHIKQWEKASDK